MLTPITDDPKPKSGKDGVLFLFFAIHLFTLSIGVILLKLEEKRQSKAGTEMLPPTEPSES